MLAAVNETLPIEEFGITGFLVRSIYKKEMILELT